MMINWAQGILHTQRFRSRPFERWRTLSAGRRGKEAYLTTHDMTWHDITHIYIYIYLDLRKDTNDCPFARFLPLGRISCKGAGNGHFLTTVVNFGFRTFWADITLLCVKMCRFFWAGKGRKYLGRFIMTQKWKHEVVNFFLEIVVFILKWTNLQKMDRNQTKICPGKKFVSISLLIGDCVNRF